jgi:hypothetical protein
MNGCRARGGRISPNVLAVAKKAWNDILVADWAKKSERGRWESGPHATNNTSAVLEATVHVCS